MLERLVAAVRSPKLADQRSDPAGEVLAGLVSIAVTRMGRCADQLSVDSSDEEWEEAWQEMGRLEWVVGVAGQVLPEEAATIQHQLLKPRQLLAEIHDDHRRELVTAEQVAKLLPVASVCRRPRLRTGVPQGTPRPAGVRRGVGQDQEEAWRVSTAGRGLHRLRGR